VGEGFGGKGKGRESGALRNRRKSKGGEKTREEHSETNQGVKRKEVDSMKLGKKKKTKPQKKQEKQPGSVCKRNGNKRKNYSKTQPRETASTKGGVKKTRSKGKRHPRMGGGGVSRGTRGVPVGEGGGGRPHKKRSIKGKKKVQSADHLGMGTEISKSSQSNTVTSGIQKGRLFCTGERNHLFKGVGYLNRGVGTTLCTQLGITNKK